MDSELRLKYSRKVNCTEYTEFLALDSTKASLLYIERLDMASPVRITGRCLRSPVSLWLR